MKEMSDCLLPTIYYQLVCDLSVDLPHRVVLQSSWGDPGKGAVLQVARFAIQQDTTEGVHGNAEMGVGVAVNAEGFTDLDLGAQFLADLALKASDQLLPGFNFAARELP
jgi:hypothetical protein